MIDRARSRLSLQAKLTTQQLALVSFVFASLAAAAGFANGLWGGREALGFGVLMVAPLIFVPFGLRRRRSAR